MSERQRVNEGAHVQRPGGDDPTIGRLVADATRDISALVQSEIRLAKTELRVSAKAGGLGAALFVVAGFLGLLITILLSIAFAYLLTMTGLHPAWCFLIVAGAYALLAAILVVVGIGRIKKIRAPEKTIATASKIPSALKGQTSAPTIASVPGQHRDPSAAPPRR